MGLVDLGYIRPTFTWNHGASVDTRSSVRLDRGLCDDEWRKIFPSACIKHLTHFQSNHCLLLLQLEMKNNKLGERPFRFHASWMLHKDFSSLVDKEWKWAGSLTQTLKEFQSKIQAWNQDTFENIFKRKKRNVMRHAGVQRALGRRITEGLLKLEMKLRKERREILLQEELLRKQKSRNDWLKAGDGKTKFFHTSTLVRRRRNRIEGLKDDYGNCVEDKD